MITNLEVHTQGKGLYEITAKISAAIAATGMREGLCTIMIQHTSASLTIQENADPSVARDLQAWVERQVPEGDALYTHVAEGPDDMPSHIKAALTATTLSIPVVDAQLALGTWQGVFVWEHRRLGSTRRCVLHLGQ